MDNMGDRDKLEEDQMKGLTTLSHEEQSTDVKRRQDMIIRRPMLGEKGEKISFDVFKGNKT